MVDGWRRCVGVYVCVGASSLSFVVITGNTTLDYGDIDATTHIHHPFTVARDDNDNIHHPCTSASFTVGLTVTKTMMHTYTTYSLPMVWLALEVVTTYIHQGRRLHLHPLPASGAVQDQ